MIKNYKNAFDGKGDFKKATALYSLLWMFCALIILAIFYFSSRSFLWMDDGVFQHYASFQYLCDYLNDLISDKKFDGFFNYTLGQGLDVLTTLNSYDFTDPVCILCAFLFPMSMLGRYTLMVFIKLWLVGFSFLFYCRAIERHEPVSTAAAALAYAFSGAVLYTFSRHPNFINWAYFLPFFLGGAELYFRKGKRAPIVLFVFLNVLVSYYTFYMSAVLLVIYVLVHSAVNLFRRDGSTSLANEMKKVFGLMGLCLVGVLLSSLVLFPTVHAYLNNSRIAEDVGYTESLWSYGREFYLRLFESLFVPHYSAGYSGELGLNTAFFVPLIFFFFRKGNREIKALLIICVVMMCLPIPGSIMNGLSYASNRWSYAFVFYVCLAFVLIFPDLKEFREKAASYIYIYIYICVISAGYICLCLLHTRTNNNPLKISAMIVLALMGLAVLLILRFKLPFYKHSMLFLVMFGVCFEIIFVFSPTKGNYVTEFMDKYMVESGFVENSSTAAVGLDDDFYRIEMLETRTNVNGYNGVNGTGFWWSMVPSYMMDYYTDLDLSSVAQNCNVEGLDGRAGLLSLAGVKYYTRTAAEESLVPFGYEEIESPTEQYQVFENRYALPLGYTYSGYISEEEYEKLNGIEKEQALMQAAVLEEAPAGSEHIDISLDYESVEYDVLDTVNAVFEEGKIICEKGGSISFSSVVPEDCEIYLLIDNIELEKDQSSLKMIIERDTGSYYAMKLTQISNTNYKWPVVREALAVNLGYGSGGDSTITLTFVSEGTISYDGIKIIAVPMSLYHENVKKLGQHTLENILVEPDRISGTISLPEKRILQLAVPYSEGWTAYVDGEEAEILRSDVMYMALPLEAGEHSIELSYKTPWLREGLTVSVLTLLLWLSYELVQAQKRKK